MANIGEEWQIDPTLAEAVLRRVHWISKSGLTEVMQAIRAHHRELEQRAARNNSTSKSSVVEGVEAATRKLIGRRTEAEAQALMAKSMGAS